MRYQDDQHYIRLSLQGDTQAFGLLVQKHERMVFTLAVRMLKNQEDAQEAAQDAFVKVYQALTTFSGNSKFTTWLYRIVYNECLAKLRKAKVELQGIDDIASSQLTTTDLDGMELLQQEERSQVLKNAMEQLPPSEAAILTLFYLEEQSIKEVASVTGLTEGNVKVQLYRGRKNLLQILQKSISKEFI